MIIKNVKFKKSHPPLIFYSQVIQAAPFHNLALFDEWTRILDQNAPVFRTALITVCQTLNLFFQILLLPIRNMPNHKIVQTELRVALMYLRVLVLLSPLFSTNLHYK